VIEGLFSVNDVSGEFRNAEPPTVATELPRTKLVKLTPKKAEVPMVTTESGMFRVVIPVYANAPLPIAVTVFGIVKPVSGADSKAKASIWRTEESRVKFPAQAPPLNTVPLGS
jgi:hypothetical protein